MRFILSLTTVLSLLAPMIGSASKPIDQKQPTPPLPYDADLYRNETSVYSVHADFLYWSVQEGALDYAIKMNQPGWGPADNFSSGNYKSANFGMEPGFKVALSYFRAPKYWEMWLQYTRMTGEGNDTSHRPDTSGEFLTATWPQIFSAPLITAKSHIHMNYNVVDYWFDRVFFPNPHLRMRLLGGATMAWIDQFWKLTYSDNFGHETTLSNRWNFMGGGLRLGSLIDWYWFTDVYMVAGTTFAAYLGTYQNKAKQWVNFDPSDEYDSSLPLRNGNFNDVRPVFTSQFYLGPSYQRNLPGQRLELFVGYELTAWFNLQEIYRSGTGAPSSPKETAINTSLMALQGLTARASLDF